MVWCEPLRLYSVCFTGKALGGTRCSVCASAGHEVKDCPFSTVRQRADTGGGDVSVHPSSRWGRWAGLGQCTDGGMPEVQ